MRRILVLLFLLPALAWAQPPTSQPRPLGVNANGDVTPTQINGNPLTLPDGIRLGGDLNANNNQILNLDTTNLFPDFALAVSVYGLSNLPKPWVIWHRGGALLAPENTLESFRRALARGARMIETDVQRLSDGTLGIMHDGTVDRTTTSTGTVLSQTAASWAALVIDSSVWFGEGWENITGAPTFEQLLQRFGNRVIIVVEVKDVSDVTATAMVAMLLSYGIDPDFILPYSGVLSNLVPFTAAGYATAFLAHNTSTPAATLTAANVPYIFIPFDSSAVYVETLRAVGITVLGFTPNPHYEWNAALASGMSGAASDDPVYAPNHHEKLISDPYITQEQWDGLYPGDTAAENPYGVFTPPDKWGISTTSVWAGVRQGWMCPIPSPFYQIDLTSELIQVNGGDATRWFSVDFLANDLPFGNQSGGRTNRNGYTVLSRKNGGLLITRFDNGVHTTLGTFAGAARTDGTSAPFRFIVTATTITVLRVDNGDTLTVTDSTYRPLPYIQFGAANSIYNFKDVTLTVAELDDGAYNEITVSEAGTAMTINPGAITMEKFASVASATLIGRIAGGGGAPSALTVPQVQTLLGYETALGNPGTNGYVLSSTTAGVRSWVAQSGGGGLSDGDFSDITVSGTGTVMTIDPNAVTTSQIAPGAITMARFASVASGTLIGRIAGGGGDPSALAPADVKTLLSISNVDNSSDANKPVSTATQTALDLKQPLDSDLTDFALKTAPSGAVVGTTDTQTLTNKTIAKLPNLSTNGFVTTTSSDGTLVVDTEPGIYAIKDPGSAFISEFSFSADLTANRTITHPNSDVVLPVGITAVANEFLTGLDATTGVFTKAQPTFANLSGAATTGQLPSGATLDTEWDTAAEINAATTDADFATTETVTAKSASFTVTTAERGTFFDVTTGASNRTATLPDAATAGNGWYIYLRKTDTGVGSILTSPAVSPAAVAVTIQGNVTQIVSDGTNYYAIAISTTTENSSSAKTLTGYAGLTLGSTTGSVNFAATGAVPVAAVFNGAVSGYTQRSDGVYGFSSSTTVPGTLDTTLSRNSAGILGLGAGTTANLLGGAKGTFIAAGTATSCTGATIGTGSKNNAGFVTATSTGASTVVITFSVTAATGWACVATNGTTANLVQQTATSTTTATLSGTTVSGDVIRYIAMPF